MALTVVKASGIDITGNYTVNGMNVSANLNSGNANLGNLATSNYFSGNGSLLTGVIATTANYSAYAGNITVASQPNITSVGTLSSLTVSGTLTATAGAIKVSNIQDNTGTTTIQTKYNSNAGDVGIVGNLHVGTGGTGNITASYFIGNGSQLTGLPAGYANSDVANYLPTYTGNISAGNANLGNLVTANYFTATGNITANNFITTGSSGNISGANNISANTFTGTLTTSAQPNITSVGTLTSLDITGGLTVGGNLTVNGTLTSINSTIVEIDDLAMVLANDATSSTEANGAGIIINGASANMLYINSTNSFTFSHKISADGELLSNISASNITGQVANSLVAGTVYTNAQPNITSVGTLSSLTVTGLITATGTGLKVANIQDASGTVSIQTRYNTRPGDIGITGNLTVGTGGTGNISATNITGNIVTAAQTGITSLGTLTGLTSNGIVNFINSSNVSLGAVGNVKITGGSVGQYLQTDGTGNLVWADTSSSSVVYVPNSLSLTNGVYVSGNLESIQTFGDYADTNGAYILTDGTGSAPAWYLDIDFISVSSFNRVVMNINYTQSSGHTVYVQLYNNSTSAWDNIGTYTGLGSYYAFALEVISDTDYKDGANKVLLRLSHSNGGNAVHQTSIDYIALQQSNQGPQGPRGPTGAAGNAVITDNTSTNATYYPIYATSTSGNMTVAGITTTKLTFNPSSGQLTVQDLNTLSDATLKTNAEIIEDPMSILSQIFGMGFNWSDSGKKSYGVMAQMLEKILPELVTTGPDGKKSVNYIPIIAFLVEAVKKQQTDIEALKKR